MADTITSVLTRAIGDISKMRAEAVDRNEPLEPFWEPAKMPSAVDPFKRFMAKIWD